MTAITTFEMKSSCTAQAQGQAKCFFVISALRHRIALIRLYWAAFALGGIDASSERVRARREAYARL
jgi:hypothetical protein